MKNFITAAVIAATYTTAFAAEAEQDKYTLTCKLGETSFQQQLVKPLHSFTIDSFSKVNVEVTAKNGASLTVVTSTGSENISLVHIGGGIEEQKVQLNVDTGGQGAFAVKVELPKFTINGKAPSADEPYILKIDCLSKEIPDDFI